MAITLTVEDGTGVAGANTYASEAYARSFAADVGLVLPADSDALAALLLGAMAYVEAQPYQGQQSDPVQALQWPRKLVFVNGVEIPSNTIPENIKKAQVQAASMSGTGTELFPTVEGQLITEDTVGPITTKYSDKYFGTWNGINMYTSIDVYLKPYLILVGGYRLSSRFGF